MILDKKQKSPIKGFSVYHMISSITFQFAKKNKDKKKHTSRIIVSMHTLL